ncbi:hypothetical protein [Roseomonas populi]|uniref:Uncharacterized protein n=1 Tax=Roseomonas populi TaxID=3121582 RepID=A0ABT1XAC9_9PROT|nr:hypothetical protein [Roseomonas pecuniae]MCR0985087.1 hypothetical protein [Roseomonas pecuniae]
MEPGDLIYPDRTNSFWRSPDMRKHRISLQSTFTVQDDDAPAEVPDSIRIQYNGQDWSEWLPRHLFVIAK